MKAEGITVQDIKNLAERKLSVEMPDYQATVSTRNLVSYVRKAYPLPKGMEYATNTTENENGNYEITIKVLEK